MVIVWLYIGIGTSSIWSIVGDKKHIRICSQRVYIVVVLRYRYRYAVLVDIDLSFGSKILFKHLFFVHYFFESLDKWLNVVGIRL